MSVAIQSRTVKPKGQEEARVRTVKPIWITIVLIAALAIMSPRAGYAQISTTGTINGSVLDSSGAVVAGAKVTITQVETKTITQTVSNGTGSFAQVGLNSGHYDVRVSAPGFASYLEKNIYLEPMATYTVHASLKPSGAATTVTVSGSQAQVQTTTPEISSTVSGQEAQQLPLNGRNFEQLGSLMPGVRNTDPVGTMGTGGYTTNNSLLVNGGTHTGSNGSGETGVIYYLDGIWNSSNVVHDENIIMPNPDEISEVKALQNNFSAQYSLMGSSAMVVETKSGTSSYHGGAFEFLRNTTGEATPYFAHTPPALHWNIFGYDVGGPLFIPHIYEAGKKKTFFYLNEQWVRETVGVLARGASPLPTMRGQGTPNGELLFPQTGTFGTKFLKDPSKSGSCNAKSTAACFGTDGNGNWVIPVNRVDQNALTLLNTMVPLPNNPSAGFDNYLNTNPATTDQLDIMAKVDHNINPNLRLTGEYFVEEQNYKGGNAARYGSPWATNYDLFETDDQAAMLRLTQILSPEMTNQTSVALGIFDGTHDFGGIHLLNQVPGFQQTLPYTGAYLMNYLPSVTFSQGWGKFGTGSSFIVPRATELHDTVTDDWSWLRGKHFLQAGFTMFFGTERHWSWPSTPQGFWNFDGYATGNAMADYLLGTAAGFGQGNTGERIYDHYKIASPYFQDQWKVARTLTLSGGLRFSYMPWPSEQVGYITDFNPAAYNPINAPIVSPKGVITPTSTYDEANGLIQNGLHGVPINLSNSHRFYWSPVFGFAWDVYGNGRTSLRGGWGLTYYATAGQGCDGGGCLSYPVIQSVNLVDANFTSPVGAAAAPMTAFPVSGEDLSNYRATHIQTFSLSLQQQFGTNWFASIAGAGSVMGAGAAQLNINQPGPVTASGVSYDFDPALNTGTVAAAYDAPYKGYSNITYYQNIGKSNWTGLELSLKHRTSKNLYLTAAYTWSHGLDNYGGFQNVYAPQLAYGNSDANVPQVFTTSLIYYLPTLKSSSYWKRAILGGWQYSDMTTIQTGNSASVGLSAPHSGLASRPNLTGLVSYPKKWRNTGDKWFDTTPFAQPAPGYFGNLRNGTMMTPGLIVFNMAGYKTFPITESSNFQLRIEFFNALNHTNPNGPDMNYGTGNFGMITGAKEAREGEASLKFNF